MLVQIFSSLVNAYRFYCKSETVKNSKSLYNLNLMLNASLYVTSKHGFASFGVLIFKFYYRGQDRI